MRLQYGDAAAPDFDLPQAWLGAPAGVGTSVESSGERHERFKVLQIKFDQAGVVRAYNWSGER